MEWENKFNKFDWGIATGPVSKILVLDDDGGLDLEKYKIPKTWTVKTPKGVHYYFKWDSRLDSKVTTKVGVLPNVDTRGDGGYVVFYGFQSPFWTAPIGQTPQWLIDLLPNKYNNIISPITYGDKQVDSKIQETLNGIREGNRNASFTSLAGGLRSRGYSSSDIYGILESKAKEVSFDLKELRILTESVGRYRPRTEEQVNGASIEEFLKETETVEWIVPGIIAKKSMCFVAGLPETGKTWILIDLAIECAKGGGLWLNRFPVEKAKVLFIDQERFKGETQRRFRSVVAGKEITLPVLKNQLFIRCGTTTRLDIQNSYEAFHKEISELRPDLVIIDSFATIKVAEENNRKDIQNVLEKIKELRNEFGCTFIFIHHESKVAFAKGEDSSEPSIAHMAGSVAIPAAAELVLTVRKHESDSSMIYNTKSTLSPTISPFLVKISDIDESKTKIKIEAF